MLKENTLCLVLHGYSPMEQLKEWNDATQSICHVLMIPIQYSFPNYWCFTAESTDEKVTYQERAN